MKYKGNTYIYEIYMIHNMMKGVKQCEARLKNACNACNACSNMSHLDGFAH